MPWGSALFYVNNKVADQPAHQHSLITCTAYHKAIQCEDSFKYVCYLKILTTETFAHVIWTLLCREKPF